MVLLSIHISSSTLLSTNPISTHAHPLTHPQVSRSICYATPLEQELYHLTEEFDQDPAQHRFAELSLRAADLRVAVERLLGGWGLGHAPLPHPPPRESIEALLREADALEVDYAAHVSNLPIAWKGMTVRCMTRADPAIMGGIAYVGRVDAYIDMFICYILNWARAARLYVRNTAMRCRAWLLGPEGDYREGPEYEATRELCEALIADIVASVPYVFGAARASSGYTEGSGGGRYQPPSLAGVFCMWPVFAAASSDYATETQRTFMKRTLKYISEEMGIGQAAILAGVSGGRSLSLSLFSPKTLRGVPRLELSGSVLLNPLFLGVIMD